MIYPDTPALEPTLHDPAQARALDLLQGDRNLILSGGGGTGKTYLIKEFLSETREAVAIAAPTGVAASIYDDSSYRAVTIYNLFGFPATVNFNFIQSSWRPAAKKRKVLTTMTTLVLDEFSMIRADLLDYMDAALKKIRRDSRPFGGVRLILVGDPAQLPPVVHPSEEAMFSGQVAGSYASPYVVSAASFHAIADETDVCILTRQHRQKDADFAAIVSALRAGTPDEVARSVAVLNTRVDPQFTPDPEDGYVTLSATRYVAEQINDTRTRQLDNIREFTADISGDSAKVLRGIQAPERLLVAPGSQVMLLTNDKDKRWVNGTVGTVVRVDVDEYTLNESLRVKIRDKSGDKVVTVLRHDWKVTAPKVETVRGEQRIGHETIGRFTQFPVMPSWATTVHKAQGRTCEKVILDLASGVFAEGQTYVGISRCTSLENLVLRAPLSVHDVRVPAVARWFDAWAADQSPEIAYIRLGRDEADEVTSGAMVIARASQVIAELSTRIGGDGEPTLPGFVELVERLAVGLHYAGDDVEGLAAAPLDLGIAVDDFYVLDEGSDPLTRARALADAARSADVRAAQLAAGPEAVVTARYRMPAPEVVPEFAHKVDPARVTGRDAQDWFDALRAVTGWCSPGDAYYAAEAAKVGLRYQPRTAPASAVAP